MNKNQYYIYISAFLSILIPTTGRFVYGFTLMLELFILMMVGTLIISLIKKLKLEEIQSAILLITLISTTILYRQIITLTYAEISLVLGFIFYLPPISIFVINNILNDNEKSLKERCKRNSIRGGNAVFMGLIFFLIRDIAGYGTFTFFGKNHHVFEKVLFNPEKIGIFSFLATIPGALIFAGILLFIHIFVDSKINIVKNVENQK